MERMTHERVNGIKSGYWSPNKKEELIERLAEYEDTGLTPAEISGGKLLTGWISVKDRLPETDDRVLVCTVTKKGRQNIITGDYATRSKVWVCGMNMNVTHWMPLPEPPEGE